MLKQRVITAVILVTILLFALLASNPLFWQLLITFVLLIGFWEWLRFCEITKLVHQVACFILFIGVTGIVQAGFIATSWLIIVTCSLWIVLLIFTLKDTLSIFHRPIYKITAGIWILNAAGFFLIELKKLEYGVGWILCSMVSIWAADIGAYFTGRRFGKTKLAPAISPGKTVEGLIGGLVFVLILFVPIMLLNFDLKTAVLLSITILITSLISVGGDLFESKLKRYVNLKDSSQVLPGHGGVLDRIDSLLAGVPFFVLGLLLLGLLN
ncbi:phosphatidate cytidylyltransferase [Arenicella sp.]|nr:phosphatidate cytidylyltransferase [Arenicella sp.]